MRFDTVTGYYMPSRFFIELTTDESLKSLDSLSPLMKKTLYHEIIHFYQDITSAYGLTCLSQYVNEINAAVLSVQKSGISKFKTPVNLQYFKFVEIQRNMMDFIQGNAQLYDSNRNHKDKIKRLSVYEIFENKQFGETAISIPRVTYINDIGDSHSFDLGGICIAESMAANLEEFLCGKDNFPFFPYRTVELFVGNFFPEFSISNETIVALCDLALDSQNPGHFMLFILETMELQKAYPKNAQELYEFGKNLKLGNDFTVFTLLEHFNYASKRAKEDVFSLFKTPEDFPLNDWFDELLSVGRRLKSDRWVESLFSLDEKQRLTHFNSFLQVSGFPVISNTKGECVVSDTLGHINDSVWLIRTIFELYETLYGKPKCDLVRYCDVNSLSKTDDRCRNSPWERISDKEPCSYGELWIKWGLSNFTPN